MAVRKKKKATRKKVTRKQSVQGGVRKRATKRPGQKVNPKSLKNLTPPVSGEVRNPKGNNQYTGLRAIRERALKIIDDNFDALSEKAVKLALAGEVQTLKFLLTAGYDIRAMQLLDDDGTALDFASLAKKARDAK